MQISANNKNRYQHSIKSFTLIGTALLVFAIGGTFFVNRFVKEKSKFLLTNPNVILITIDSLRADHMGIYGYDKKTTPFLDTLFQKGVIFDNAITPAYLTFQTDASILSGLYPSQNNVTTWNTPINTNLTLLPKILSLWGYQTAAFVSPSLWPYFHFNDQFQTYEMAHNIKNIAETKQKVSAWIGKTKKPYFLFWHIYDVHSPYLTPIKNFYPGVYHGPFANGNFVWHWEGQSTTQMHFQTPRDTPLIFPNVYTLTPNDIAYNKAAYDSGIHYVDTELRQFFESMKNQPNYQNTLIVITAEHGEDLKEHGFLFHRDIYDVNIHVPLVFVHPSLKPQRVQEEVSLLDVMPTILTMLGIPQSERAEGENLIPILEGKSLDRTLFIERPPFDEYAVRTDRWKYILRNPDKKLLTTKSEELSKFMTDLVAQDIIYTDELYDLTSDPLEKNNLSGKGLIIEQQLRKEALTFRDKMRLTAKQNEKIPKYKTKLFPYP